MRGRLNNKGFSLIEMIICVTILAIVAGLPLNAFVVSARSNAKNRQNAEAFAAAQNIVETVKAGALSALELTNDVGYPESEYTDEYGKEYTILYAGDYGGIGGDYYEAAVRFGEPENSGEEIELINGADILKSDFTPFFCGDFDDSEQLRLGVPVEDTAITPGNRTIEIAVTTVTKLDEDETECLRVTAKYDYPNGEYVYPFDNNGDGIIEYGEEESAELPGFTETWEQELPLGGYNAVYFFAYPWPSSLGADEITAAVTVDGGTFPDGVKVYLAGQKLANALPDSESDFGDWNPTLNGFAGSNVAEEALASLLPTEETTTKIYNMLVSVTHKTNGATAEISGTYVGELPGAKEEGG
jgi:prepilin-type N-terminal cleavage/methylation domain-containing protein